MKIIMTNNQRSRSWRFVQSKIIGCARTKLSRRNTLVQMGPIKMGHLANSLEKNAHVAKSDFDYDSNAMSTGYYSCDIIDCQRLQQNLKFILSSRVHRTIVCTVL